MRGSPDFRVAVRESEWNDTFRANREPGYCQAMEPLQFEWDSDKADLNERKHGVTFITAKRIFDDPFASEEIDDLIDYGEERYITVGMAGSDVIVVVWTERRGIVRLISARRATRWEANEYFAQDR